MYILCDSYYHLLIKYDTNIMYPCCTVSFHVYLLYVGSNALCISIHVISANVTVHVCGCLSSVLVNLSLGAN